jgi:hypothetical protein
VVLSLEEGLLSFPLASMLATQRSQLTVAVLPAAATALTAFRVSARVALAAPLASVPADVAACLISLKASPISTLDGPVALPSSAPF